jgi:hypothetical protein
MFRKVILLLPTRANITVFFGHAGRSQEGRAEHGWMEVRS